MQRFRFRHGLGYFTPPRKVSPTRPSASAAAAYAADSSEYESSTDEDMSFGMFDGPPTRPESTKKKAKPLAIDPLHGPISLQDFEGYWLLNAYFCQVIGLSLAKVKAAVKNLGTGEKWLATALAVRYFGINWVVRRIPGNWLLRKATAWLEAQWCDENSNVWTVGKLK